MNTSHSQSHKSLQALRLTALQAIAVAAITAAGGAATAWVGKSSMQTREKADLEAMIDKQKADLTFAKQVADDYGREILKLKRDLLNKDAELEAFRQSSSRAEQSAQSLPSIAAQLKSAQDRLRQPPIVFIDTFNWTKGDDRCRTVAAQAITRAGGGNIKMHNLSVEGVREDTQIRIVCGKPYYVVVVAAGPGARTPGALHKLVKEKHDELLAKETARAS